MTGRSLKELIGREGCVLAPFIFDGLQARIAERVGHKALYMTGFGTAAAHGLPDLGLLTMSEMVANARRITAVTTIPVIADADTGYGGTLNVRRTVEEYEAAGVAALHIEDQVFPKRCGFLAGKQVIARDEMQSKVRVAVAARHQLLIIARTDALESEGWKGAAERARAYFGEGADLVFVDGIRTREEAERYAEHLGNVPRMINCHALSLAEASALGFKVQINGIALLAIFERAREVLAELARTGEAREPLVGPTFREILDTLGATEAAEFDRGYKG